MIEKYNLILEDLRAGKLALSGFSYKEGKDENGYSYDKNSTKRFQLLIALQYNRKISDEEIFRLLRCSWKELERVVPYLEIYTETF